MTLFDEIDTLLAKLLMQDEQRDYLTTPDELACRRVLHRLREERKRVPEDLNNALVAYQHHDTYNGKVRAKAAALLNEWGGE